MERKNEPTNKQTEAKEKLQELSSHLETPTEIKVISISRIREDRTLQQRVKLHEWTVKDYSDAMRRGDSFPPVEVFHDGHNYWLADGFHRVAATKKCGLGKIEVSVRQGGKREAILFAVSANETNGLRRSHNDKRKAVMTMLQDREWSQWSNRKIAEKCKVSHAFVNKLRRQKELKQARDRRRGNDVEKRSVFFCKAEGKGNPAYKFGDPDNKAELKVQVKSYTQGIGIGCRTENGKEVFEIYHLEYDKNNPKKIAEACKRYELRWNYKRECYSFKQCRKIEPSLNPHIKERLEQEQAEFVES